MNEVYLLCLIFVWLRFSKWTQLHPLDNDSVASVFIAHVFNKPAMVAISNKGLVNISYHGINLQITAPYEPHVDKTVAKYYTQFSYSYSAYRTYSQCSGHAKGINLLYSLFTIDRILIISMA